MPKTALSAGKADGWKVSKFPQINNSIELRQIPGKR